MNKKIMTSMRFRENISSFIDDMRHGDNSEIIVTHYDEPVAKLVKLSNEEINQIKIEAQDKNR